MHYSYKTSFASLIVAMSALCSALSGCASNGNSSVREDILNINGLTVVSAPAGHLSVVTKNPGSEQVLCLGRLPDSIISNGITGGFGSPLTGNATVGTSSNDLMLGGRSPNVLIVREYYYRMCELAQNYKLTKNEALTLFSNSISVISKSLESNVTGTKSNSSSQQLQITPTPVLPLDQNSNQSTQSQNSYPSGN
jgi:hypothetical protein